MTQRVSERTSKIDWVAELGGSDMWQRLPAFIREWPILISFILLIMPLLYLASQEGPPSRSSAHLRALSQNEESAGRPTAVVAPGPSTVLSPTSAPAPAKIAQDAAQAPAKAPVMS